MMFVLLQKLVVGVGAGCCNNKKNNNTREHGSLSVKLGCSLGASQSNKSVARRFWCVLRVVVGG